MKNQPIGIGRLGQAWTALANRAASQEGCLQAEEIWEAVQGRLPPRQTRRMVDHLAACPGCSEAWQLARQLAGDQKAQPAPRRSALAGWPAWAASAAACALLLAGLAIFQPTGPSESEVVLRQAGREVIHSLVSEDEALPRDDFELRWTLPAPDQKAHYRITVTTQSLEAVAHAADLQAPRYRIPADLLSAHPAGTLLQWQVKAFLEDGRRIDSPTFLARLK